MDLKKYIRSIPDYPKKGILFRDITTLLKDSSAFVFTIDSIVNLIKNQDFDKIVAVESRGFVFASAVAYKLSKPLIISNALCSNWLLIFPNRANFYN